MSGIIFFKTRNLDALKEFYGMQIGCTLWVDRGDSIVFRNGNFLFGFNQDEKAEVSGVLTFFYEKIEEVDHLYEVLKSLAVYAPVMNDQHDIYHFFVKDPEGRTVEIQSFDCVGNSHLSGEDLLKTLQSVRDFDQQKVSDEIFYRVVDISRYTPTSRSSQFFYLKVIQSRKALEWLSKIRGKYSAPIGKAPMAVAVCSDPDLTGRPIEDGCIAAYHFMLSAWSFGLGTCWIPAMDREDVKERLNVPQNHYIATVTPLGYPKKSTLDPMAMEKTAILE